MLVPSAPHSKAIAITYSTGGSFYLHLQKHLKVEVEVDFMKLIDLNQ